MNAIAENLYERDKHGIKDVRRRYTPRPPSNMLIRPKKTLVTHSLGTSDLNLAKRCLMQ